MQKNVPVNPPPLSLNPIKDAVGVSAVDYSADFDHLFEKSENLEKFLETGKAGEQRISKISSRFNETTLSRSTERNERKKSFCRRHI